MSIYLLALLLVCLYGIKFNFKSGFADYMSLQKTGSIKGIFVIIVFLSHIRQYVKLEASPLNAPFSEFMLFLGQLMVVAFMFCSGYGVALSLRRKRGYAKTLPYKRIFAVWYHYVLSLLPFFAVGKLLGKDYDWTRLLKAFVGLSELGNSVWFIFTILMLYALTFLVFIFAGDRLEIGASVLTVLSFGLLLVLSRVKSGEAWWYDTLLCYPLGMWYYIAKPKLDRALLPSFSRWFSVFGSVLAVFCFMAYLLPQYRRTRVLFIPEALVFALVLVLFSMRVSVDNRVLRYFGKHVFSVYILQRLPMIVFSHFGLNAQPVLFTLLSFVVTVALADVFDRLLAQTDRLLRIKGEKKKASAFSANN